jgi:hypothetical protein
VIGRLYSGLPRDDTWQVQASKAPVAASVHPRRELSFVSPPRAYTLIGARKAVEAYLADLEALDDDPNVSQ